MRVVVLALFATATMLSSCRGDDRRRLDEAETTFMPSPVPTLLPTPVPSPLPTEADPTYSPTSVPSAVPSREPTSAPSGSPSLIPTTYAPSGAPTPLPSTAAPSSVPTYVPSLSCDDVVFGPTPRLSAAEFSRSGAMVLVDFSESTDQGGRTANEPFPCSLVLSFPNASMADCFWVNATQIDATVSEAGLLPGENVTLVENTLKPACEPRCHCFDFATTSSVKSIASTIPVPAIVFQGPTSISVCDDLSILAEQSTGSGGRPMTFEWSVEGLGDSDSVGVVLDDDDGAVEGVLDDILSQSQGLTTFFATSSQLGELFDAGVSELNVTLALTNSFELVDRSSKAVKLLGVDSSGNGVPFLQIVGGSSRRLTRSETLLVVAEAFATDCTGDRRDDERRVDLVWTLSDEDGFVVAGLNSTSNNVLRYQLEPYTLDAATTYELLATAIDVDGLDNTAVATVVVERGSVTATISGGASRSAWVDEDVTISAAESRDFDVPDGEDSNLTYAWDCTANSTIGIDCDLFDIQDASFVYIPAGTLSVGSYLFTVNVTTADGRTATASSVLSLEAATRPTVDIVSSLANVRAESKLTIEAEVTFDGAVSSEWSLLTGELAMGLSLSEAARTEITAAALEEDQTNQYRHDLVLSANSLVPGGQYSLTLRAQKAGTETFGFSVIEFAVNTGPTSGNLLVSPSSGRAFFDTFELRAANWVTDPDALPLHYTFKTENDVILGASSLDTVLSNARLPAPIDPPSLPLTLVVTDLLGAEATLTRTVEISNSSSVSNNSLTNQTISQIAEEALDTAFAQYSLDAVCQVVTASASASDGSAGFIDTLVRNLTGFVELYADDDRETSEQVAATLLAPTSFSSELKPDTVVDALNLVHEASEVLVVTGLGDSETTTPDVIARVLSNLLESSLFSEEVFGSRRALRRREESSIEEQRQDATSVLLTTVDALALAQRNNLVENEASIGFTSSRVRSASRRVSSALGEAEPSIQTTDMNASARVTAVDGVSYAGSVTEFVEINPHNDLLNEVRSNIVRLQLNASGAEASNTTQVELVVSGSEDLQVNSTGNSTINVTCECGFEGDIAVTCPGDVDFNVTCTGIPQEIVFACPGLQHSCSTWNGVEWIEPPDCTTVENDDGTTACVCNIANEATGRDYTTVSELSEADEFPKNLFDSPPSLKESQYVIIAFACLIVVVALLMILGWCMDKRAEAKDSTSNLRSLTRPALSWMGSFDMLPIDGRDRGGVFTTTGRRIYRIFTSRHPFSNYFCVYNPLVSRSLRAFKMGVDVTVLFLALGLETFFEYRPEIECKDFESESKCETPKSRGTEIDICTWDRCSDSCYENDISSDGVSTIEHFIILILVLALCLPILSFADWLFANYLIAPVPRPLRGIFCLIDSTMTPSSTYAPDGRKRYTKGDELEEDEDEIVMERKEGEEFENRPRGMAPPLTNMASSRLDDIDDSAIVYPIEETSRNEGEQTDLEDDDDDEIRNADSESVDLQVDSIYTVNAGSVGFTVIDEKMASGAVPADDDSDEGVRPRRRVGPSDLPWLISQCEETMNVERSSFAGKKKVGRRMPTLGKAIKISVRTAQSAAASTRRAARCHPPWSMTESRRAFNQHEELLRNLAARVKHAIRLRQIELRDLQEEVRKTEKDKDVAARAIARLRRLEAKLLDQWRWVPSSSIWEANIREKIRTEIDEAFKLKAELDQIRGMDAEDTRYLRQQKILEREKASHLTRTEKMIYQRTKERSRWQVDVPTEPPHTFTYILAWLFFVVLIAFVFYFSLLLATDIGRGESKLWLIRVVMAVFLFYCVIAPLEILWFDYWLPSLLSERMNKIRDPTKIKKFPYETTIPETVTFYLVLMNQDEYRDTRIGDYTFSNSNCDDSMTRRDSRVSQDFYEKELEDIYSDIAYKPRLGTRIGLLLSSLLLHVPNAIYELVFEEVLLLIVLGSGVLTKLTIGDSDSGHSESLALAVVVVTFLLLAGIISFLIASCNYLEARYIIARSRVDVDQEPPSSSSS